MSVFSSINNRLWLTYVLLIAFVLAAALAGIVVAFRNSPLLYWEEFVRLNYVTDSLANRLNYYSESKWDGITNSFLGERELPDVRVIIVDGVGHPTVDSEGLQRAGFPRINPSEAFVESEGIIRVF